MGGKKRKIPMEKIQKKESRAVAFSQRRNGLYNKASQLCRLSGAEMAILTTPCSSSSHASFYSFGHSSADGVVAAFLDDQRPVTVTDEENLGLGLWWEDDDLAESENPEELKCAIESMSKMLRNLKEVRLQRDDQDDVKNNDIKKKDLVSHETRNLDQTLNLKFTSATSGNVPRNFNKIAQEQDQIMAARNLDDGYTNQELDLDQLIDFE
ncbi:hypothetical protein CARUB_v10006209mg, partial [Capsella rubella]